MMPIQLNSKAKSQRTSNTDAGFAGHPRLSLRIHYLLPASAQGLWDLSILNA